MRRSDRAIRSARQGPAPALQLQQALGPLLDGLEVEDPGAGEIAAGAVDLVVGEGAGVHGPDLVGDRGDGAVGLLGHRAGVDPEQPGTTSAESVMPPPTE